MKNIKKLSLLLLLVCASNLLQAQLLNTDKVINTLKSGWKNDLVTVCAHRGYWRENGVPENSLRAIQRAFDNKIEMVEIDIKMSSDGEPVLMHDWNLGRTTELGMGRNDLVSSWPNGALQTLRLKDKNGNLTNEHLPTFRQVLSYIRDHQIAIILALDIKDKNAAWACWNIMNEGGGWKNHWGNPAAKWTIFKINATVYNGPGDLEKSLGLSGSRYNDFRFVPVYTTNMIDKIDCLGQYKSFRGKPYFIGAEVDIKQRNGIQQDVMNQAWGDHKTIACFNAIPDAGGNNFYYANGTCCYTLASLYFRSAKDPSKVDTQDNRGSWQFLVDIGVRWITTDEPVNLINDYLNKQGFRNTSYFY
ncbi:glycerophosphodiester phosphodiesterase family protein [Mucilaginibacter sp. RCC_168]|uniref:glycerophosphodiester phosphodiesterase family protein n=1 Tax=Mucilaginibacter sp. RCC_168 TaxID=3239221 RepID=UPI0035239E34